MRVTLGIGGATLHREPGDKRIGKESTVVFHMRNLLNAQAHKFTRYYPYRENMTASRLALRDRKAGVILWHERYAVENAADAFNKNGSVFFQRVDDEC